MSAQTQSLTELPRTVSREAREAIEAIGAGSSAPPASIEEMRQEFSATQEAVGGRQRQRFAVTTERTMIAGVPVIIFRPSGGARSRGVLLNLHGGGFLVDSGSQTENIPITALTGMTVIAVLYRLAPEYPFPAAVDDAAAVYQELLKTTAPSSMAVFGTSAGAILSSQLMVRLREANTPLPAALGFFSGTADLARDGDSESILPKLMGGSIRQLVAPYIGATPEETPSLSPIYGDLHGLPPTLVMTSTRDQLLSQSTLFHRALRGAGVDADLVVFEAMPHAFWAYIISPESDEAFGIMSAFFRLHVR
jgi:acetyl esterase/lipase